MKKIVHRHSTDKATVCRDIFDSLVKIIFYCSLEIMEGSCHVAQIKVPFHIEKKYAFHLCCSKSLKFCLRRGDHNLQNQNVIMKNVQVSHKKFWKMQGHQFETGILLEQERMVGKDGIF